MPNPSWPLTFALLIGGAFLLVGSVLELTANSGRLAVDVVMLVASLVMIGFGARRLMRARVR